jgi:hypothetical protein
MQFQAMVDHDNHFWDVYVVMFGSMNDYRIFWLSNLYQHATYEGLLNLDWSFQDGIRPYLIGDKGYPLLPWLMIPYE